MEITDADFYVSPLSLFVLPVAIHLILILLFIGVVEGELMISASVTGRSQDVQTLKQLNRIHASVHLFEIPVDCSLRLDNNASSLLVLASSLAQSLELALNANAIDSSKTLPEHCDSSLTKM